MKFEPEIHHLSNGITLILDNMDLETANVRVCFLTGGCDEKPEEYGITHFCEHMLCKGTHRFPEQRQRNDFLENRGGWVNAVTGTYKIALEGRIIAENLELLMEILADQLNDSLFDEKKIEIERGAIIDELHRAQNKQDRQFYSFLNKNIFNVFVPNGMTTLGNEKNIKSFTREQMLDFIKRRFSAKNCTITISGKIINKDSLIKKIETLFAKLPTHEVIQNRNLTYTSGVFHNHKSDNTNVRFEILFPCLYNDTYENIYKNKCVGKFERYLKQEILQVLRHKSGLIYSLRAMMYGNDTCSINGFGTETTPENIEKVVSLMAKTAYKLYTQDKIKDDDLLRFHNMNKLSDASFLESSDDRLIELESFYQNFGKLYDFYDAIEMDKKISADEVIEYSKGYFDGPLSVVSQGADFDADLKQIWIDNFL